MTTEEELNQRKAFEKIRLYTQFGITDPYKPTPEEERKLKEHFENLSKQKNNDRKDYTAPTYSAFLHPQEDEVIDSSKALDNLKSLRLETSELPESAIQQIIPTLFFETSNEKLAGWKKNIGDKNYNKLTETGRNLWDVAGNIFKNKFANTNNKPALRRIGMKWNETKANDPQFQKDFAENSGFSDIRNFANTLIRYCDDKTKENSYFASGDGRKVPAWRYVAMAMRRLTKEDLILLLQSVNDLSMEELSGIQRIYELESKIQPRGIRSVIFLKRGSEEEKEITFVKEKSEESTDEEESMEEDE